MTTVALTRASEEPLLNLIFAAHCHQPLGNFDEVVHEACDRAYLPFLEVLAAHPAIKINLHYSGSLLEWLDEHRPDVLEALEARADQIEWMGGGFYEPILPTIPSPDAHEQLSRLSRFLLDRFGHSPRGAWIAERVWDPSLPSLLAEAGMEYTVVDDFAFLQAGYLPEHVSESFITDHLGKAITVFPIAEDLRFAVPDAPPDRVLDLLKERHDRNPDALAVIADDGEKYGLWPDTSARVYQPGNWLDQFFTLVQDTGWLELTTFEEHLEQNPAGRKVALPASSYREMSEWSLPAKTRDALTEQTRKPDGGPAEAPRGGWWPNFLVEYPEAAVLYRKMLRVSRHVAAAETVPEARTELLRAQGNDPYWHGAFGGLYFPHLRARAQEHLIRAQTMVDAHYHRGRGWSYLRHLDWDADGHDEIEVELPDQSFVLDPHDGGCLLHFDDKPSRWSVGDVVARHPEAYHLDREQPYDPHPRRWLVDHCLPATADVDSFARADYTELLPLPTTQFVIEKTTEGRGMVFVRMATRDGAVSKTIQAEGRGLQIAYRLDLPEGALFGPEVPVAIWEGAGQMRVDGGAWQGIDRPLALSGHRFRISHEGIGRYLLIVLRRPGTVFSAPIATLTQGNAGHTSIMQGIVLWPHWSTSRDGHYELSIEIGDQEER